MHIDLSTLKGKLIFYALSVLSVPLILLFALIISSIFEENYTSRFEVFAASESLRGLKDFRQAGGVGRVLDMACESSSPDGYRCIHKITKIEKTRDGNCFVSHDHDIEWYKRKGGHRFVPSDSSKKYRWIDLKKRLVSIPAYDEKEEVLDTLSFQINYLANPSKNPFDVKEFKRISRNPSSEMVIQDNYQIYLRFCRKLVIKR
ncbi:MAG: hypothetical protein HRT44_05255 [Bdellovibrionales bacterium]|nr:hypothetical protein [Bdellovibrionales bacterium]NQZ18649.1 hypothetical protein [Bdellovibrionales bacterium]